MIEIYKSQNEYIRLGFRKWEYRSDTLPVEKETQQDKL